MAESRSCYSDVFTQLLTDGVMASSLLFISSPPCIHIGIFAGRTHEKFLHWVDIGLDYVLDKVGTG